MQLANNETNHKLRYAVPTDLDCGTHVGTVDWFNDAKGYGYIQVDNYEDLGMVTAVKTRQDAWVHFSAIIAQTPGRRRLFQGQRVKFNLRHTCKGWHAAEVEVLA